MTNVKVGRQIHEAFVAEVWQRYFSAGVLLSCLQPVRVEIGWCKHAKMVANSCYSGVTLVSNYTLSRIA